MRVYQNQITNAFKFEVISESKYGQYKIKCKLFYKVLIS